MWHADALTPVEYDAGILNTLSALDVRFLAVGHDHGNGYCCQHVDSEVHVCFGRHSGYGGYSHKNWSRGARVYELKFSGVISLYVIYPLFEFKIIFFKYTS